jgi:hypothetical protein
MPAGGARRILIEADRRWLDLNADVLIDYRNGDIAYTQDAIEALKTLPETERP